MRFAGSRGICAALCMLAAACTSLKSPRTPDAGIDGGAVGQRGAGGTGAPRAGSGSAGFATAKAGTSGAAGASGTGVAGAAAGGNALAGMSGGSSATAGTGAAGTGAAGNAAGGMSGGGSGSGGSGGAGAAGSGGTGSVCNGCTVAGACYDDGAENPANECEICQRAVSQTAFVPDTNASCAGGICNTSGSCASVACTTAAECDDTLPCTNDDCTSSHTCSHTLTTGCLIGGACVADGALAPNNDCMSCQSGTATNAYSPVAKDTACTPSDPFTIYPTCDGSGVCGTEYCSVRDCWSVMPSQSPECSVNQMAAACLGIAGSASCASTVGCGQDAQYPDASSRTFSVDTVGSDKLVTDSHTGLVWQGTDLNCAGATAACASQNMATNFCLNLPYGGLTGWRAPNMYELLELLQVDRFNPATDFPGGFPTQVWSSTLYANDTSQGWSSGFAYYGNPNRWSNTMAENVRCVHGRQLARNAAERYFVRTTAGQDRVLDRATALEWQSETIPESSGKSWTDALAACEGLVYGGYDDWRLPNVHELLSLLDFSKDDPMSSFPGATKDNFWSSSPTTVMSGAYPVGFSSSSTFKPISGFADSQSTVHAVRCARGPIR